MLAGVGVLQCTLHASLNIWAPTGPNGRPFGMGARGREASDYRGEAFTASGIGTAKVVSFSPNEIVVEVAGATIGDRVVINQNFDPAARSPRPRARKRCTLTPAQACTAWWLPTRSSTCRSCRGGSRSW